MARIIKIDNAELKRREHKKRKGTPKQIVCRILIVCEGEKTEPNYFKSFDKNCNGTFIYELDLQGGGINTIGVVDKAIELRQKARTPYDRVWAVFDKDSFSSKNFNGAITKATANNIDCAWSNEALERSYDNKKYSDQNPCTTVYKLVRQIIGEDEELNQHLTEKVDL